MPYSQFGGRGPPGRVGSEWGAKEEEGGKGGEKRERGEREGARGGCVWGD
jgi:hypothetical protein